MLECQCMKTYLKIGWILEYFINLEYAEFDNVNIYLNCKLA